MPHAPLADDATFFRRIHLDLTGRIPDGNEAREFAADPDPAKRDRLIDQLVGSVDWRDRWTYWHLDLWPYESEPGRLGRPQPLSRLRRGRPTAQSALRRARA